MINTDEQYFKHRHANSTLPSAVSTNKADQHFMLAQDLCSAHGYLHPQSQTSQSTATRKGAIENPTTQRAEICRPSRHPTPYRTCISDESAPSHFLALVPLKAAPSPGHSSSLPQTCSTVAHAPPQKPTALEHPPSTAPHAPLSFFRP